jgi:chromosomal replication initiation ATPase DnaA
MLPDRMQLLLPFPHDPGYDSRDFLPAASNQEALAWFDTDWPDRRLALWGPAGCGKSHLLHIWAERAGARLLAGPALTSEPLLLHLLNTARDRALDVLLSARTPPSRWPVCLRDLSSRLRAITAVEIRPPSDDLLAALLMRLLSDRQLSVTQHVQNWLLTRLPRSPAALRQAVARLDRASLACGQAITRSLADRVLADRVLAEDGFAADADEVSLSEADPSSHSPGFL